MVDAYNDSTYQTIIVDFPPAWMKPVGPKGGPKTIADLVADAVAEAGWVPLRDWENGWASLQVHVNELVAIGALYLRGVIHGLVDAGILPSTRRLLGAYAKYEGKPTAGRVTAAAYHGWFIELRDWGRS